MAKAKYRVTGKTDAATGASIVEIDVEVKGKTCVGTKRLFTTVEQLGGLPDDELLKMVNYAEDLFARSAVTAANTPAGGKERERVAARKHWKEHDAEGFLAMVMANDTTSAMNSALDAYFAEHKLVVE